MRGRGIWECIPLENMRLLVEDHGHITALADGAAEVKGTVEPMSEIHTGTVFVCIHSSFLHRYEKGFASAMERRFGRSE